MSYLALARKYRPQTFDELIGQDFVNTSLKNAMELGRVSHAYLFTGARGVGKTSAARIMAKALNCLNPVNNNPCNVCENCLEITGGTAIDVTEIDGASNRGVDEIRQLREAVKFIPVKCKYKVYIVDEVHMLTDAASNALLKTLEEPPSYVVFIFATTDAHKIMPTILSRCQRYDFRKIPFDDMKTALSAIFTQEKVKFDDNALSLIIRQSEGCMRDALSFSDQIISYANGSVLYDTVAQMLGVSEDPVVGQLYAAILKEERQNLDELISKLVDTGVSLLYATEKMLTHTRNLLLLSAGGESLKKELTAEEASYYASIKDAATEPRLFALFQLLQKLHNEVKYSSFARYTFEFGLFKAASLSTIIPLPLSGMLQAATPTPNVMAAQMNTLAQPAVGVGSARPINTATTTNVQLSDSEKRWNALLKELASSSPALAPLLAHGTLADFSKEHISIVFPKERLFQYNQSSRPERKAALETFLREKLDSPELVLELSILDEKKKPLIDKKEELESQYEQQLKAEVAALPAMAQLLELFEADMKDVRVVKNANAMEASEGDEE
ncbi:MAG: DNA polymerase III subunit gamma/tau [Deferribacteraceae bacterium]|jgi:DNA polymerase-3 subunit gamma/tau|nr:DNA polymerase III subunit gamma/tau [Deferribacteraceae bacterium]